MTDIFREVDEELRRDRLEKLWKRYGVLIVVAVVAVVAGTGGFIAWRNWQQSQAETQTQQLADALRLAGAPDGQGGTAGGNPEAAADALSAFAGQTGAGPGTLARFYEAGLRAREGNGDAAVSIYDQLAQSSGVAQVYRDLATVLSVMHQVQSGDPGQLRARLQPLTAETSPWRHSARELTALLAIRAGDRDTAAKLFAQLQGDASAPSGVRNRATELAALYAVEPQ